VIRILHGDCRDVLPTLPGNSVDSIVTDPPYELGFMGKKWDGTGIAYDVSMWRECLRVLKPGGHLLAFGGTRTQHRMVCAIEDAGFEIRDTVLWLYGSGFPKSLDVSKAIDKAAGAEREVVGKRKHPTLKDTALVEEQANAAHGGNVWRREWSITSASTDAAKQWQGWGTALKPAHEPICMARKPLIGTVAANVLKWGTGGLNIDGCRVDGTVTTNPLVRNTSGYEGGLQQGPANETTISNGRWPANITHDGSPEVLACFPEADSARANGNPNNPKHGKEHTPSSWSLSDDRETQDYRDTGSAARFFYTAKASRFDRNDGCAGMPEKMGPEAGGVRTIQAGDQHGYGKPRTNHHPTVKPTDLMRYLCRLVTPPDGTVLDPFAGSGSTLKAAELEGFSGIGIELDQEYCEIARRRIASDMPLFAEVAKDA
jgi:DNA modification methylase